MPNSPTHIGGCNPQHSDLPSFWDAAGSGEPWSDTLDPDRVRALRLLIALHPKDAQKHETAKTAQLHLSRILADERDFDEAAITAVLAAATAQPAEFEHAGSCTLSQALNRTLSAKLEHRLVLAILAGAAVRSRETLDHMLEMGTGTHGYHPQQIESQRKDAATMLRAFTAWEGLTGTQSAAAPDGS